MDQLNPAQASARTGNPRLALARVIAAATTCIILSGLGAQASSAKPKTDVATESGVVRGELKGDVIAWKGVPFAAAPVGPNRWRAPQPVQAWSGIRQTTSYASDCMQTPMPGDPTPLTTTPSEDCLYLNVWRPANAAPGGTLPVIVWIYGGGFMWGGSSIAATSGDRFAERGAILVSFNYRLGRFGFFAHPALTSAAEGPTGNFGYMDIVAALQWVQRNIAQFGGDAGNVTVFGESAGGAATNMVLTSPATQGLFNRVLVMSSGGLSPTGLPMRRLKEDLPGLPSAETVGMNFAKSVGIAGSGPEALAKLRGLPASQVAANISIRSLFVADPEATYTGGPVADGAIATDAPLLLITRGQRVSVPVMIGSTSADVGGSTARSLEEVFTPFGANAVQAQKAYDPVAKGDLAVVREAVAMDRNMTVPARLIANAASDAGAPAYFYRFSYVAESEAARHRAGAAHASDVPFVFNNVDIRYGAKATDKDKAVAAAFQQYLVNFATSGNPNGSGLPTWKPYAAAPDQVMNFGADGQAEQVLDPWKARLDATAALFKEP